MALRAQIEKLEDVAEPLREFYVAGKDGKFVLAAEGVEDVSGLKTALQAERDNVKKLADSLKQFDGVDLKAYKDWTDKMDNDEEAKLFKDGKRDELRSRWTGKMQEAHQKEIDKLMKQHKAELDKTEARAKKFENRVLENALRAATIEVEGFHKPATRDAIREGQGVFTLDENGNAIKKREDGTVVIGKDGKTPYTPKDWLEEQRSDSPHWFAAAGSGTGAGPNATVNGSGQKQMTRGDFDRLSPQAKADFFKKDHGVVVDT